MKVKIQCGNIIHELEGKYIEVSRGELLKISISKSGEYAPCKNIFGWDDRSFLDMELKASFNNWDGYVIEGDPELTEIYFEDQK